MEECVLASLSGLSIAIFSLCLSTVFLCGLSPKFSFFKELSPQGLGAYPVQYDLLLTNSICNNSISK